MTDKLSERMRKFREAHWEPTPPETVEELDLMWRQSLEIFEIGAAALEQELEGRREAMRINTDFKLMSLGCQEENSNLEQRAEETDKYAKEGWAWVEEVCAWLDCGAGGVFEIESRIEDLKARADV